MIVGPVPCQGCRALVTWRDRRWRDGGRRVHRCAAPRCGAFMPQARERCARTAGHGYEHRTAYALANAADARRRGV